MTSIGTLIKKDLIVTVECTLEEFFHGCRKEIFYSKTVMADDMKHEREVEETRIVEMKPGMMALGEGLRIPGEGHHCFA